MLVGGLALAACKKEPVPIPEPIPTKTEMLTKSWKPDSLFVDGNNVTALFASARWAFRTDNKYVISTFLGADSGSWAFANNETQIVLDPGPDQEVWNIETLTTSLLRVNASDVDGTLRAQFSPAP
ncbi:MAG: hypothetical protein C0424_03190 [Sphingobacteriaceae bacterium]|nr:hypothetical protein [Sphingobacteriaceae bacterium]